MIKRNESDFFHPRKFIGNNIKYRIGTSLALARFKEAQSFLLNQTALNPFHKYSGTAREIILFNYDVSFDFLCELEQYLLVKQEDIDITEIIELSQERYDYMFEVLRKEKIINQEYLTFCERIHEKIFSFFKEKIKEMYETRVGIGSLFGGVVDFYIRVMNQSLYRLEELDMVFFTNKPPVFILDSLSCEKNVFTCPISERVNFLRKVRPFDEIIIKDYLQPDEYTEKKELLKENLKKSKIKYTII